MTEIARVRTVITGFPGAPGLSTQYFRKSGGGAWAAYDDLMTSQVWSGWVACLALFTPDIAFDVQDAIDVIEDTTGEIQETLTGTLYHSVGTSSSASLPPANAIAVTYRTGGVVVGKHVRGRTFLSPLAADAAAADGTPTATALGLAQDFATAWLGAGTSVRGVVWSRPVHATLGGPTARLGSSHDITSEYIKDQFAVLRSRRD